MDAGKAEGGRLLLRLRLLRRLLLRLRLRRLRLLRCLLLLLRRRRVVRGRWLRVVGRCRVLCLRCSLVRRVV